MRARLIFLIISCLASLPAYSQSMQEMQKIMCFNGKELATGYANLRQQGYSKEYIFEHIDASAENDTSKAFAKQIATNIYNFKGNLNDAGSVFYSACLKQIGVL